MLGAVAAILLCLLPSQVNGLTATAKCLSGHQWMFTSIGQSPCDVAVELASVCAGHTYQLGPLGPGWSYTGPWVGYDNSCLCSSVYYSLSSACANCQGEAFLRWSDYNSNCTMVHLGVYTQQIPVGVKVPAYAYQDVSLYNQFNVTVAYDMSGSQESSRPLPSSTTPTSSSATASSSSGSGGTTTTAIHANVPSSSNGHAIIAGVVAGGLVGLGLIAALITFLVLRSKQKSQNYISRFQHSPNTGKTAYSNKVHNSNDRITYPSESDISDPDELLYDPNLIASFPQTTKQNTGRGYSGMPEL